MKKTFYILVFVLLSIQVYCQTSQESLKKTPILGQQLTFLNNPVDTLQIISNSSHYHFDSCGTTTGIADEYLIVFDNKTNTYILNIYKRTEYKYTFKPESSFSKSKTLAKQTKIDNKLIEAVLTEFTIKNKIPNFNNSGLTIKSFLKLTDKKHIIKVAKLHGADWHLKKNYSSNEQNNNLFKQCQNIDTFNLFLKTAFDTSGYAMVTDVSDVFNIYISSAKATYRFEGKYPNVYKQPWYNHGRTNELVPTSILNLSINSALINILPDSFSSLWTLKPEALTNEYITWYLKRRGIIL